VKFPIRLGKFKNTRILAGASGLLLALTLVVAFVAPVSAVPQWPHQFWGTVSIDGVPAPEGTEVVARIANVTENFTTVVAANHTYGWSPPFYVLGDDPDTTEKEGGNDGDTIDFYVAGTWATNFTFKSGAYNELNLSVEVITNATLEGHVTFPAARVGDKAELFVVKLFEAGNLSNVLWTGNATTNSTGVFNISSLAPDTYDIGIKNATCVSELESGVLTAGNTTVVNFTIREGDVHSDDYVDMVDYGDFSYAYETLPGDAKWNANADLDRSGYIDMSDYSMFSYYFNEMGAAYGHF